MGDASQPLNPRVMYRGLFYCVAQRPVADDLEWRGIPELSPGFEERLQPFLRRKAANEDRIPARSGSRARVGIDKIRLDHDFALAQARFDELTPTCLT